MNSARPTLGISLKMYHGHSATRRLMMSIRDLAVTHPALVSRQVELFVLPTYPNLMLGREIFDGTGVGIGAQDVAWADAGAYTGEVSAVELAEIGCAYVELGHAERRNHLGETNEMIAAKTFATLRNGLVPVLCVGEEEKLDPASAARLCVSQLEAYLQASSTAGVSGRVIVAYEPQWAIGATEPANPFYIEPVANALRDFLAGAGYGDSTLIYGGSAGPGLISGLYGAVDGLFLGRSGSDPDALRSIVDEAASLLRGGGAYVAAAEPRDFVSTARSGFPTLPVGESPNTPNLTG